VTAGLTGAWLGLVLLQAVAWIGACVLGAGVAPLSRRLRAITLVALGTLATAAAIGAAVVAFALVGVSWSFGAEKLLVAAPVGVLSSAAATAFLVRTLLTTRSSDAPPARRLLGVAIVGALGAAVGPAALLVIGGIVTPAAALSLAGVWALASSVVLLVGFRRPLRAVISTGAVAVLCIALLALFTVFGPSTAGPASASHHIAEADSPDVATISVDDLRETDEGTETRHFDLEARHETITLPGGGSYDAISFGSVPGPAIVVQQGELVEVTLTNRDVEEGVTLHWHGYDVPNGDDGVAGVTQDVVAIGESYTYRFVADEIGSYWYHTHQGALSGITRGLYGSLVVLPNDGPLDTTDVTALIHTMGSTMLVGDTDLLDVPVTEHDARVRLANTDQTPRSVVLDGDVALTAIDGQELAQSVPIPAGTVLRIPAGGRMDLIVAPGAATALAVEGGKGSGITFGGATELPKLPFTGPEFDVLDAAVGPMPSWASGPFQVEGTQVLDRLIRVVDGLPKLADTINGAAFPFIAPIVVSEGDVVRVTIENRGTETHPMHLHGHHAVVLEHNGVAVDGALWLDSIDVRPGDVWVVAFVADNPGLWMDHCHNLEHARDGMVMHLAYEGITSPFELGGAHGNDPE
jgi:FtsP/CotA-like multicopper oxidase with cupredoxin domain